MLGAKDAAACALKHLFDLLGTGELAGVPPKDVALEEIELIEEPKSWKATLSYPVLETENADDASTSAFWKKSAGKKRRCKVISVSADDGELLSMKLPDQEIISIPRGQMA